MLLGNMCFSLSHYTHIRTRTHVHTGKTHAIDNEVNQNLLSTKNVLHTVLSSPNNIIINSYLLGMHQIFRTYYI